ncbi:DUF7619 domain-containing protein [Ulvibacter antarcticus]|uniref:Putative repeat protein (TIGR01451 family)/predicted secreted protein (Por secretion system target) n=1 Tax=Ulvibacter antarcticus TaxID=442714 RepID=A0A3L9YCX7_9FLAO|nr:T9SS type A sorting domain-containing protein [Ulvibacter antarcticus]RMA57277.1 putative repeat protein (TIGR01451 family)/predicted secreted protein (Por secretion system target) [Ulvibacter antarcticus]
MKNYYILLFCFFSASLFSQIVTIPDANFKTRLLDASPTNGIAKDSNGTNITIDTNANDEIELSEALTVYQLFVSSSSIVDMTGIEAFTNLTLLDCGLNQISNLDLTLLVNLEILKCTNNQLNNLLINNLVNLQTVWCFNNQLTNIDLTGLVGLLDLKCSSNLIESFDASPAMNLVFLVISYSPLSSLNLGTLPNLTHLECVNGQLSSLDVSGCSNLESLLCYDNMISSLDLSNLEQLEIVNATYNALTSVDVTNTISMNTLQVSDNNLTTLDASDCINVSSVSCSNNEMISLFVKNGVSEQVSFGGNSLLEYICADEEQFQILESAITNLGYNAHVNSYCTFTPGGEFFDVEGSATYDIDTSGCDPTDPPIPFLEYGITNGSSNGTFTGTSEGLYHIPIQAGAYTITPNLNNPDYFTIVPSSLSVNFPTDPSPMLQDFCVVANGVHPDLDITIIPTTPARPGFEADYKLLFYNKGNQTLSGNVVLSFNDDLMDYVISEPVFDTQATNEYGWDYVDINPFESRAIDITFLINTPTDTPPVNIDDELNFVGLINPLASDETPADNEFALKQIVVGSFDPNDKTCLEGPIIDISKVGDFVHYLIRFENTGTFPAENIVVKDTIDTARLDVSSLRVLNGSHDFETRINDNVVEFIFENINLPIDDENNDGYILFKIRTLPTLGIGDTFTNSAGIYFDFNFPVITNSYETTIQQFLNVSDFGVNETMLLYPNPSENTIHLIMQNGIRPDSYEIYNMLGQTLSADIFTSEEIEIDISTFSSGQYFLKVFSDKGISFGRILKK